MESHSRPCTWPPGSLARRAHLLALLSALLLSTLLSACGGPPEPQPTSTPPQPTELPAPVEQTAVPAAQSGPVTDLREVEQAVVRIEMEGRIVDVSEQGIRSARVKGLCSGFLIDAQGTIVTNNHCVTGAGLVKVYLYEDAKPRIAKVLGVSECADLAVIQIAAEDLRYLEWYGGDVYAGLPLQAAGFPGDEPQSSLNEPQYTLTPGQVSAEQADGNLPWCAVGSAFEHTAKIHGGSSGGPSVTLDAKVVGVNFAGIEATDLNVAISVAEARGEIEKLRQGENIASIGLNSRAEVFRIGETVFSGVWVRSVKSGSPVDQAGLIPGDLIVEMEGIRLAQQGTMEEYCNIIGGRSGDTLAVQVLRFGNGQDLSEIPLLEGQINGTPLQQVGTLPLAGRASGPKLGEQIHIPTSAEAAQMQADHSTQIAGMRQALFEDFQNASTHRRGWRQGDTDQARLALEQSVFRFTLKQQSWNYVKWQQGAVGKRYAVELRVLAGDGSSGTTGVGIVVGEGGDSSCNFILRSDHTWQIITMRANQLVSEQSTPPVPSQAITAGVNANVLWVVHSAERTEFWINAAPVAYGPPGMATGASLGFAGLALEPLRAPAVVDADELVVWVP